VEDKVEKVERDIAEVKTEIALYRAFPSLNTFEAAADLDEFAAFARGDRARQRNALEVHLAQALPQRADALRELQGTLRELQRKENALRDEKARLEAARPTVDVWRVRAVVGDWRRKTRRKVFEVAESAQGLCGKRVVHIGGRASSGGEWNRQAKGSPALRRPRHVGLTTFTSTSFSASLTTPTTLPRRWAGGRASR
jgi:hypothetical protein